MLQKNSKIIVGMEISKIKKTYNKRIVLQTFLQLGYNKKKKHIIRGLN